MLDALVRECRDRGIGGIHGYYFKTAKNGMVANHYGSLGFEIISSSDNESEWRLDLTNGYENRNKFIEVAPFATVTDREGTGDLSGRL